MQGITYFTDYTIGEPDITPENGECSVYTSVASGMHAYNKYEIGTTKLVSPD